MTSTILEHLNFTVSDPDKTAAVLCKLFDWHIRWQGEAKDGGYSVHVGSDEHYLAVYSPKTPPTLTSNSNNTKGGLNHVGVVVDDLDVTEARVIEAGFKPHMHANYEPGRRFYFNDDDDIEYEVVSYR